MAQCVDLPVCKFCRHPPSHSIWDHIYMSTLEMDSRDLSRFLQDHWRRFGNKPQESPYTHWYPDKLYHPAWACTQDYNSIRSPPWCQYNCDHNRYPQPWHIRSYHNEVAHPNCPNNEGFCHTLDRRRYISYQPCIWIHVLHKCRFCYLKYNQMQLNNDEYFI